MGCEGLGAQDLGFFLSLRLDGGITRIDGKDEGEMIREKDSWGQL